MGLQVCSYFVNIAWLRCPATGGGMQEKRQIRGQLLTPHHKHSSHQSTDGGAGVRRVPGGHPGQGHEGQGQLLPRAPLRLQPRRLWSQFSQASSVHKVERECGEKHAMIMNVTIREGCLYCQEHYQEKFLSKCAKCSEYITGVRQ